MTSLTLDPGLSEAIDRLMATGRFQNPNEILRESISLLEDPAAINAALDAAIADGLADADAGRLIPSEVVFARLEAKYRTTVEQTAR